MDSRVQKSILGFILAVVVAAGIPACKSTAGLMGPADQTAEAAELVIEANASLKKIKILYDKNENKRDEIKEAMATDDAATVKKLSEEVVYLINDGDDLGRKAVQKIDEALELKINDDYDKYLRLKRDALLEQLKAFEEYRQAARELRTRYDPKNTEVRQEVAALFKRRSENYQKLMEKARDHSSEANELAKEVLQRKAEE